MSMRLPRIDAMFAKPRFGRRKGLTLLEVVIAGSMLAVVMTSLSLVLRTARTSWEANDNDYGSIHYAHTVALHFVREAREARSVASFAANDVAFTLRDGSQLGWRFEPNGIQVLCTFVHRGLVKNLHSHSVFITYPLRGICRTASPLPRISKRSL